MHKTTTIKFYTEELSRFLKSDIGKNEMKNDLETFPRGLSKVLFMPSTKAVEKILALSKNRID